MNESTAITNKIKGYDPNASMRDCHTVLQFWKGRDTFYPMLSMVARLIFTPAATGTETERVFSLARNLCRKHRSSLIGASNKILVVTDKYLRRKYELN